jgi:hypothetical protein
MRPFGLRRVPSAGYADCEQKKVTISPIPWDVQLALC